MKTEFNDKFGTPLYVGDIVRYSLGKTGFKGHGPTLWRVVSSKKGVKLADPRAGDTTEGTPLRKSFEQYLTLIDSSERKESA